MTIKVPMACLLAPQNGLLAPQDGLLALQDGLLADWGMIIKLAIALGVVLGTALPAAGGFDPSAQVCAAPAC